MKAKIAKNIKIPWYSRKPAIALPVRSTDTVLLAVMTQLVVDPVSSHVHAVIIYVFSLIGF